MDSWLGAVNTTTRRHGITTGNSFNSTLEYTKPHSHLPAPGRVGAYKVRNVVKGAASTDPSAKPHAIVAGHVLVLHSLG